MVSTNTRKAADVGTRPADVVRRFQQGPSAPDRPSHYATEAALISMPRQTRQGAGTDRLAHFDILVNQHLEDVLLAFGEFEA